MVSAIATAPIGDQAARAIAVTPGQPQLALTLGCDRARKTVVQQKYMAYPLSVSPTFRLDALGGHAATLQQQRAYLYRMNTSPGLLAGDALTMTCHLKVGSKLYFADQAAIKVHRMPQPETFSQVDYSVQLEAGATLEFLPEPVILFEDAALFQTADIVVAPSASLCWGEIVLPGRWARGEHYQFREFSSRVRIRSDRGKLVFVDQMKLLGKTNRFARSGLFSSAPVLGSLIVLLPETVGDLAALQQRVEAIASDSAIDMASSVLPGARGLLVRAMAARSQTMQKCFKEVVSAMRQTNGEAPLPYGV